MPKRPGVWGPVFENPGRGSGPRVDQFGAHSGGIGSGIKSTDGVPSRTKTVTLYVTKTVTLYVSLYENGDALR